MAPPDQNREFPFFKITAKRTMSQENDHDFRDQHKILVLEMLTNPCGGLVTKILLHSVIHYSLASRMGTEVLFPPENQS